MTLRRFIWTTLALAPLAAQSATPNQGELEKKIVEAYSNGHCEKVREITHQVPVGELRPNVIAVVASCIPTQKESEKLFSLAESKDPHGDLIALLHARHLSQFDREAAKPHWVRVLMYARSDSLREMARESLSGLKVHEGPLNLSSWTWTAQAQVGASHHSAPWFRDFPQRGSPAANALDADLYLRSQHWIRPGSISGVYRLDLHQYPNSQGISTQFHHFEVPLALRVGASEDLIFRPFFEQNRLGGQTFSNAVGFGFTGVAYRDMHKETVSGYASSESTLFPNTRSPVMAHYHFDYQWEWFPPRWLINMKFAFDNYSASRISQFHNVTGDFNQSHNDGAVEFMIRRGFDRISLGLASAFSSRFDNHASSYYQPGSGALKSEKRNDFTLDVEPHLIWRMMPQIQLKAYAKLAQTWSSVSAEDYGIERNHQDYIYGLALRTYWSSY